MDETEDINRLIRELNTGGREPAEPDAVRLSRWLHELHERGASDLLLVAGAPPAVRVDGAVHALPEAPLSGEEIEEAVLPALHPAVRVRFQQGEIADGSHKVPGLGRFRINLHRERGRGGSRPAYPPPASLLTRPSARRRIADAASRAGSS